MEPRDFVITQGKTFSPIVRWGARPHLYKAIASIVAQGPARITTQAAHAIPDGWPCAIVACRGMRQINALLDDKGMPLLDEYHKATLISATVVEFDDINAAEYTAHTANSGFIQLFTPVDLTSYLARMTIRDKRGTGSTVLDTLTDANGKIVLNNTLKTIQPLLSATATALYTWTRAVYDLELESPTGLVYEVLRGSLTVEREATA